MIKGERSFSEQYFNTHTAHLTRTIHNVFTWYSINGISMWVQGISSFTVPAAEWNYEIVFSVPADEWEFETTLSEDNDNP